MYVIFIFFIFIIKYNLDRNIIFVFEKYRIYLY